MNSAIERLVSLRVGDVMSSHVRQVSQRTSMHDVAKLFADLDVSGAPVVDDLGQCVGMITAVDFVERERVAVEDNASESARKVLVQDSPDEPHHIEEPDRGNQVDEFMTRDVVTALRDAPILEAARTMCAEHIHRLVVVDDRRRPVGLVSSLDLVAAMVKAIEE